LETVSGKTAASLGRNRVLQNKRIVELDGLRGFAALMVVVSHYVGEPAHGIRAVALGWLGVNIFFVLSGFLIGSIILEQHAQPGFFKRFYLKRAARIVPVYFVVFVLAIFAAGATTGHVWSDHPFSPFVYGSFTTNFFMSFSGADGGTWLKPTWTLAVEEQFYLLLPLLIVFTPRRFLVWVLGALWLGAIGFRIAFAGGNPIAALSLLPCRMDLLLSGVLIALAQRRFDLSRYRMALRIAPLAAAIGLLLVAALTPARYFTLFSGSITSIGIAGFLLAIMHGAPEGARFRAPWLRYFGQISYALYLVHQPVSGLLHGLLLNGAPDVATPAQIAVTILSAGVSVALAAASWRWLESPILGWAGRSVKTRKEPRLEVQGAA
jgi:peptidoglycan/LPS O-acetylase OafA/YrhL